MQLLVALKTLLALSLWTTIQMCSYICHLVAFFLNVKLHLYYIKIIFIYKYLYFIYIYMQIVVFFLILAKKFSGKNKQMLNKWIIIVGAVCALIETCMLMFV